MPAQLCCAVAPTGIERLVSSIQDVSLLASPTGFDRQLHYWDPDHPDRVAQYLVVVDALVGAASSVGRLSHST